MSSETIWIVVPVYERANCLDRFICCLERQTYQNYNLVVVDHGRKSIKTQVQNVKNSRFEIIRGKPRMWWSAAVNHGIKYVLTNKPVNYQTPILIQNDDVIFGPEYLSLLITDWGYREDVVIGSLCLDQDTKQIIRANMVLDKSKARIIYKDQGQYSKCLTEKAVLPSDVLTGRGTLLPVKVFSVAGFYNEKLLPHYGADYELIFRAKRKGFTVLVSTRAVVYAKLESQYMFENNIKSKIKYLFDRKSAANVKKLFFYSYLCFGFRYGTYFFMKNLIYIMRRIRSA